MKKQTWIKRPNTSHNIEYIEAFFATGGGYSPHRHDTYATGITLSGVQSFHYRGSTQHSLPGHAMILHPDEIHDGFAGTELGFQYHMLYIKPEQIQQILKGKPLPFIKEGISKNPQLFMAIYNLIKAINLQEDLAIEDTIYDLANILDKLSSKFHASNKIIDYTSTLLAKEYMVDNMTSPLTLDEIAQQVNKDKWSLSRDFRLLFGTSPHRYITMRRLEFTKSLLIKGESFVNSAIHAGFFDQSHMIRHFKKAFGLSPAQWLKIIKL